MKKILVFLSMLAFFAGAHAQQNFQGEITYKLHASADDKPDAELKVLFGKNKLKIRFKEKDNYEKDALLILLDSAASFVVNSDNKTYKKKPLQLNHPAQKPEKKSILGYSTTPLVPENNVLATLLGGLMSASNTVFYVSDSLNYLIPDSLAGNKELAVIQKNKIVLGIEVKLQANMFGSAESDDWKTNQITAEAIEIKPMLVNDEEFSIPAEYVNAKDYVSVADTMTAVMVDSAAVAPAPKKTPVKKPARSGKPKIPVKTSSSAVKRKE